MSDLDFTEFDALYAERLLEQQGGERMRRVIVGLLKQGATKKDITGRLLTRLPSFTGTAVQLGVIVDYLANEQNG